MYEVVFTNVRTNTDLVGSVSKELLVQFIMDMIGGGWMLSELRLIDEKAS